MGSTLGTFFDFPCPFGFLGCGIVQMTISTPPKIREIWFRRISGGNCLCAPRAEALGTDLVRVCAAARLIPGVNGDETMSPGLEEMMEPGTGRQEQLGGTSVNVDETMLPSWKR